MNPFVHLYAPFSLESTTDTLVLTVVFILLVLLLQYVAACIIAVARRPLHGASMVWQLEEAITDSYVWGGFTATLVWLGVCAYSVLSFSYPHVEDLIPQAIALAVVLVATGWSLYRLRRYVSPYRSALRS